MRAREAGLVLEVKQAEARGAKIAVQLRTLRRENGARKAQSDAMTKRVAVSEDAIESVRSEAAALRMELKKRRDLAGRKSHAQVKRLEDLLESKVEELHTVREEGATWRIKAEETLHAVELKAGTRVHAIEKATHEMMRSSYIRIQSLQQAITSFAREIGPVPTVPVSVDLVSDEKLSPLAAELGLASTVHLREMIASAHLGSGSRREHQNLLRRMIDTVEDEDSLPEPVAISELMRKMVDVYVASCADAAKAEARGSSIEDVHRCFQDISKRRPADLEQEQRDPNRAAMQRNTDARQHVRDADGNRPPVRRGGGRPRSVGGDDDDSEEGDGARLLRPASLRTTFSPSSAATRGLAREPGAEAWEEETESAVSIDIFNLCMTEYFTYFNTLLLNEYY